MKTIKSSLFLAMAAIFTSSFFIGCYTQLACLSDEPDSVIDSPTIIVINDPLPPIINPIGCPIPIDPAPPTPPYYPLPPAGDSSTSPAQASPVQSPHRETGYQRPSNSNQNNVQRIESTPSRASWNSAPTPTPSASHTDSGSSTRTSGSTRGGR